MIPNCCNCDPILYQTAKDDCKCTCGPPPTKCAERIDEMPIIPLKDIRRFAYECLVACGATPENALVHADVIVDNDYRGFFSDGLQKLEFYCKALKRKQINGNETPQIIMETSACALVEGRNALGSVVGKFSIDLAMKKAIQIGVGVVVARGSTPFGRCSYYIQRAIKAGLIGVVLTNTEPIVVPPGARKACLGTNPIGIGAPLECTDNIILDMPTSVTTHEQIELEKGKTTQPLKSKREKTTIEQNMLLSKDDATENGIYKAYCLGLCVDILTGILAGGNFGPKIPPMDIENGTQEPPDICHFFMVINPETFETGFRDRLQWFTHYLRNLETIDSTQSVLVPGDNIRQLMDKVEKQDGIRYDKYQMGAWGRLAKELKVKPLLDEKSYL